MDDRRRDGGTNSTLGTKEQGTHLTLNEHDDDDDDDILNLNLPTTTIVAQPFNVIKWQLKFNPVA